MGQVNNKREMYLLFEAGAFGNKTRSWMSVEEYLASDFEGRVALRYMEHPGGPCVYQLTREAVLGEVERWLSHGYKRNYIQVSEMLDANKIRLCRRSNEKRAIPGPALLR